MVVTVCMHAHHQQSCQEEPLLTVCVLQQDLPHLQLLPACWEGARESHEQEQWPRVPTHPPADPRTTLGSVSQPEAVRPHRGVLCGGKQVVRRQWRGTSQVLTA